LTDKNGGYLIDRTAIAPEMHDPVRCMTGGGKKRRESGYFCGSI
jgi:hypothetical protein